MTSLVNPPVPNAGEGWQILRVALPRLVRRLDRVHAWLDRYTPERFIDAADDLRGLGGAEGLALLAAVPPTQRATALGRVELDDEDRKKLRALAERLGDPEDRRSPAAGLRRMVPSVEGASMEVPGDDPRGAAALLARGRRAFDHGEYRSARESAQKGLEVLRANGMSADQVLEGETLNLIGAIHTNMGEPRRAIECHEQSLTIARALGDRRGQSNALGNLGLAYSALGQTQRAIECHEKQLAIAREIGDRSGEGGALGNLGNAYHALGQPQRAIECYERCLAIAREIGDRRDEAGNLGNLGNAYHALGQTQRAIDFHQQALAIAREVGDRQGEGNVLGNLGNAYADLGQPQWAIDFYQQYLAIAREIGDRRGEANASWNMGLALEKLGRLVEAVPLLEVCVAFEQEIGHPDTEKHADHVEQLRQRLATADGGDSGDSSRLERIDDSGFSSSTGSTP